MNNTEIINILKNKTWKEILKYSEDNKIIFCVKKYNKFIINFITIYYYNVFFIELEGEDIKYPYGLINPLYKDYPLDSKVVNIYYKNMI